MEKNLRPSVPAHQSFPTPEGYFGLKTSSAVSILLAPLGCFGLKTGLLPGKARHLEKLRLPRPPGHLPEPEAVKAGEQKTPERATISVFPASGGGAAAQAGSRHFKKHRRPRGGREPSVRKNLALSCLRKSEVNEEIPPECKGSSGKSLHSSRFFLTILYSHFF